MSAVQYSAFQTLPSVIVKGVAVCLQSLHFTDKSSSENSKKITIQYKHTLQTCILWRQIILAHLYTCIRFNLDGANSSIRYLVNKDTHIDSCADLYYAQYIRTVDITINLNTFDNEAALFGIQNAACMAPHINANRVYIILTGNSTDTEIDNNYCARLQQLAIGMKQIVSYAKYVNVYINISPNSVNQFHANYLAFAKLLFEGIAKPKLTLHVDQVSLSTSVKTHITGLAQFICNWNNSYKNVVQIIHANASSLNKLSIDYYNYNELETIFFDDNSKPIVYPILKEFSMADRFKQKLIPVNPLSSATPFPALEMLCLYIEYPFINNIVFRGNHDSLQTLKITISRNLETVLSMKDSPLKRNFKSLNYISIYNIFHISNQAPDINNVYASIVEKTTVLRYLFIQDLDISMALMWKLQNGANYRHIKHLKVIDQYFSLQDTITIIQGMPLLRSVKSKISSLGNTFHGMDISQIYQLVTTQYVAIGQNIRYWTILNSPLLMENTSIACAILITCICPNLNTLQFNADGRILTNMFNKLCASKLYRMCNFKIRPVTSSRVQALWLVERNHLQLLNP